MKRPVPNPDSGLHDASSPKGIGSEEACDVSSPGPLRSASSDLPGGRPEASGAALAGSAQEGTTPGPPEAREASRPLLRGTSRSSINRFLRAGGKLPAEVKPSKGHPIGPRRTLLVKPGPVKRPRPKAVTKAERARRDRARRVARAATPSYAEWLAGRSDHPTLREMYRLHPEWSTTEWAEHFRRFTTNPTKENP